MVLPLSKRQVIIWILHATARGAEKSPMTTSPYQVASSADATKLSTILLNARFKRVSSCCPVSFRSYGIMIRGATQPIDGAYQYIVGIDVILKHSVALKLSQLTSCEINIRSTHTPFCAQVSRV